MENNTKMVKMNFWKRFKESISNSFKIFLVGSKTKGEKVFKITFIFILYALAIVGIVFGTINLQEKNDKKGLFGDSYTITYKLDTNTTDENTALKETKTAAEKFSNWLLYKGISNNGVSYQVKNETLNNSTTGYVGYLFVNYTNIDKFTFEYNDEEEKDVDVYPSLVGVRNMYNSNIEVWRFYKPENFSGNNTSAAATFYQKSPILSSSNFDYSSAKVDTRDAKDSDDKEQNTYGVQMNLSGSYDLTETGKVLEDIAKKNEENSSSSDDSSSSSSNDAVLELLVFQNLDGLINQLNYAKYVSINYDKYVTKATVSTPIDTQKEWSIKYNSLKEYESDLVTWADAAKYQTGSTVNYNTTPITKENFIKYYESVSGNDKIGSYPSDANDTLKTIADKYLIGSIDATNYKKWFPTTSSSIDFSKQKTISIQQTSATQSTQKSLIYQFKNTTLPIQFSQTAANASLDNSNEYKVNGDGWMSSPYIQEGVTKMTSYNAILLASGVVLLIIAIIVSVLYRIPGLMGAFAIIASGTFSAGLLALLNVNFSIPTTIAIFVGVILSIVCVSFTMERIRRLLNQKNSVFDSIQTALKKSIMTTIDINVTTIIIALSLFFFAKGELSDLALSLVLVPLLVLGSIMVFFYLPLYIYSGYRKTWKVRLTLMPSKTESKIKIWFDSNKWWFIWLSTLVIIIVAGILLGTIGINNSSFNNGTLVYISGVNAENETALNAVFNSNGWFGSSYLNGVYQISSNKTYSFSDIENLIKPILTSSYTLNVSTVSPTISSNIFMSGVYGTLAGFGFILVYYVIRANVLTIIPMFFINCLTSLICISLSYVVQFPISNFFIYVLVVSSVLSNVIACLFMSVIKTRFNKRKIFENEQIKTFIVNNVKSLMNTLFITTGLSFMMFVVIGVMVSPTTLLLFINLAFVSCVSIYLSYFMIAHMYYYVIIIRQLYVNKILYDIDNKINNQFKEVDEQLIYSINKFH